MNLGRLTRLRVVRGEQFQAAAEVHLVGLDDVEHRGDRDDLWEIVSLFVDEESVCCPFYNYEQREIEDGVALLVGTPAASVKLDL